MALCSKNSDETHKISFADPKGFLPSQELVNPASPSISGTFALDPCLHIRWHKWW